MSVTFARHAAAWSAAAALFIVAACGGGKNPVGPTPPTTCTYNVSVGSVQSPAAGQTVSVHVDTAASCAWTAHGPSWVTLSAASGTGPADVVITIAANDATAERSASVTIADKEIAIRQSGRTATTCTYALESSSSTFGAEGGTGRLTVRTAAGCAWTAQALASWITFRVGTGTGPGDIEYNVAAYTGTSQRETRIVVDQASFTVRQDPPTPGPCSYIVDPTSTSLHWHGAVGDGFDVRLTTAAHCSWTAASGAPWIELLTANAGTGSAVMRVRVGTYTQEQTRSAPLMIRWPTDTAGQNVWITQEGCYYAISLTTDSVTAAGGRRRVGVFGTPVSTTCSIGCPWTASANVSWIHVVGATSRAGDDDLFFDVDPNTTGAARTGTLTIAGLTLTVTQGS